MSMGRNALLAEENRRLIEENERLREAMSLYRGLAAAFVTALREAPSYARAQDAYTKALRLEQPEAFTHEPV